MKAKIVEWLFEIILLTVGLLTFVFGILGAINTINFKNNALETTAVITSIETHRDSDGDTHHTVYVKYIIEDKQYEERLNYYSRGMREGKEVFIYYDPLQPNHILAKSSYGFSIFYLPSIGFIIAAIGFMLLFRKLMKIKTRSYLLRYGQLVYAQITEVYVNRAYRVNGRNPYVINCKWVDPSTGFYYFFKSENIWFNPQPIIDDKDIKELPVYIDFINPRKYAVSIEELKSMIANL
ncbi:MAG: DUF3592 domain-containing protein [Clostridiaceae bacterium]|nr:DUF3592 domain-containing protein [Clostridiaceae bacterium]